MLRLARAAKICISDGINERDNEDRMIIAIDGPAAAGKGTLSRRIA